MAGSNQANRLQGMLSELAGSFSMENMGGAGMAYTKNIRDYMAPELDANSEESLLARQRWAQSNGYDDQANKLGVMLGDLGAANKVRADRVEFNEARGALSQLEQQRRAALDGKSPQEQVSINNNFDQAAQTLGQRINGMAGGVSGTTGTEGTDAVTNSTASRRVAGTITNMLPTLKEGQKELAMSVREGLLSGTIDHKEGLKQIQDISEGSTGKASGGWYSAIEHANSHNARVGSERGLDRPLQVGEKGYMWPDQANDIMKKNDAGLAGRIATERALGESAVERHDAARNQTLTMYGAANSAIDNLNAAEAALDKGAGTGWLKNQFPSIRDASIELEQVRGEMGLQIVQGTTFGSLSAPELKFALDTALPTDLSEAGLRDWIARKREAQTKLVAEMDKAMEWLAVNKTSDLLDYQTQLARGVAAPDAPPPVEDDSGIQGDAEKAQEVGSVDENGFIRGPNGLMFRPIPESSEGR
jgi:hypothetical protein